MLDYDKIKLIVQQSADKEDRDIRDYMRLEYRWVKRSK